MSNPIYQSKEFRVAAFKFVEAFNYLASLANQHAHDKGFYDNPNEFGTRIALMHSELSEALEGYRHGNPRSEHISLFTSIEEEFADTIIRIMDNSAEDEHGVAEALIAKLVYNDGRPYKHGGKKI